MSCCTNPMLTHCVVKARRIEPLNLMPGPCGALPSFLIVARLTEDDLKTYFDALVKSHSWSTVKIDRNGLQFFYKQVLNKKWVWVDIVKPPKKTVLP